MGHDLAPILLTGASGFLGRRVLSLLQERQLPHVATSNSGEVGTQCDLTSASATRTLVERTAPAVVVHCAAQVPKSIAGYGDEVAVDCSLRMVGNLIEAARCRIVFVSSMTVYSETTAFPVQEDDFLPPRSGYALGKWQAEQGIFSRALEGDVALRLPGLFGLPRRSGALYNAARAFLDGRDFRLSGANGIWAAMMVDDAADYVVRAATTPVDRAGHAVNVGYDGEFRLASAIAAIARFCGVPWNDEAAVAPGFSMHTGRMRDYYGSPTATFVRRLQEFVEQVRNDR